jgi:putative hydrolase of the HAD superfamily
VVAKAHEMNDALYQQCIAKLEKLTYNGPMSCFPDYEYLKNLSQDKYLITSGFQALQQSKIDQLRIERDFKGVYIVDTAAGETKKKIFENIANENGYEVTSILVIGDDPDSEIEAATALGMKAVIYDYQQQGTRTANDIPVISNYQELDPYLKWYHLQRAADYFFVKR